MPTYKAFRVHSDDNGHRAGIEELAKPEPGEGEILIRVNHSSVNYKDALAGTGKGKIMRRFPLVGGIDAAGSVEHSRDGRFREGDGVIVTGWGLSFDHDGGYGEYLCCPADWAVPLPDGLSTADAMVLGTAGFTAALAVHRMLTNGQRPELGPILITGASGGVGSIATALLARLGYQVTALSGKAELRDWLTALGATRILGRNELPGGDRPLEKAVWGGAVDNVGGATLAKLTRTLAPNGNIACIGMAAGIGLETTVMPLILRGIALLGCNSVDVPGELRAELWGQLASDWRPTDLSTIHSDTIGLDGLPEVFERVIDGAINGRVIVNIDS